MPSDPVESGWSASILRPIAVVSDGEGVTLALNEMCIRDSWWAVDRVTGAKKDLYGIEGPSRMQTELELCLATVSDKDFDALNLACSRPGTEFHDHRIANLRTPNGYFAIWDDVLTAVSYTHLDVYKRQTSRSTKPSLMRAIRASFPRCPTQ